MLLASAIICFPWIDNETPSVAEFLLLMLDGCTIAFYLNISAFDLLCLLSGFSFKQISSVKPSTKYVAERAAHSLQFVPRHSPHLDRGL